MTIRLLAVLLAAYAIAPVASSQTRRLRFQRLGTSDGLSNGSIGSMMQDRDGFLWFATEDGLNRYDGYAFTVFRHQPGDSTSIAENFVDNIDTDAAGDLWFWVSGTLNRYDRSQRRFVQERRLIDPLRGGGNSDLTGTFVFDRSGILWLGTVARGVYAVDPSSGASRHYLIDPDTAKGGMRVSTMYIDAANRVWIGSTGSGVAVISNDRETVTRYSRNAHDSLWLPADVITAITADARGTIWIAERVGNLFRLDAGRGQFERVPLPDASTPWTLSMLADERGLLWIGTFDGGLIVFDPARKAVARYSYNPYDPTGIPADRIYSIMQDRSGSVWIGSFKGGIGVYHPSAAKFEHFTHAWYDPSSLSDLTVWSLCKDRSGVLWVGTDRGGLNRLADDGTTFRHYLHRPADPRSISSNAVKSICEDSAGSLWIGTMDDGLNRYDRARNGFVRYRHRNDDPGSLGDDRVTALATDREGDLWVGGRSLDRYDRAAGRFVHYDSTLLGQVLFEGTEIQSIVQDHSGNIWVGAFPSGLVRLDKGTNAVHRYAKPSGIYNLYVDDAGVLWVGCFGKGLYRHDAAADTFRVYTTFDGLPSNFVKSVLSDAHGVLWLGTSNGLSRFDPRSGSVRNYDHGDGIQADEFRTGSCFRGRDGMLYFGGVNGFNGFHPDSIRENRAVPPVLITSFKIFDVPAPLPGTMTAPGEIRLPPGADFFSFEFVALDYSAPAKSRYAYRMEGFDRDWVSSGTRRFASYTHLDPGEYTFRVRGSNGDGVWNEAGTSVRIVILPPVWQTWWFRTGLVLLLGGLFYGLYRYRLARLLEVERTRGSIATDLHDDIGTTLTNIALLSDLARRDVASGSAEATPRLEKISSTARSLLDSMNDIVWSIKPENDALEKTILRMEDYAVEILEENGIDLHVEIPERLKTLKLPMTVRRNLFLIFKEAITNVLKHSQASRVEVRITSGESARRLAQLELSITDDGRGFDTAAASNGNGQANMAARARNLRGSVAVVSSPARGTRVEIRLPLRSPR
jgi:ligand-binding sensor domain-containing protein/signal transduction histidine kinase